MRTTGAPPGPVGGLPAGPPPGICPGNGAPGMPTSNPVKRTSSPKRAMRAIRGLAGGLPRARSPPRPDDRRSRAGSSASRSSDMPPIEIGLQLAADRLARRAAPHRSLVSPGILDGVVAVDRVLGHPLPHQVVGVGGPAPPFRAGAGRGQRLEADLLDTRPRAAAPPPCCPRSDPPSTAPGTICSCGPRARLTRVGARSTCPTGALTRRGGRPGHPGDQRHLGLGGVQVVTVGGDPLSRPAPRRDRR